MCLFCYRPWSLLVSNGRESDPASSTDVPADLAEEAAAEEAPTRGTTDRGCGRRTARVRGPSSASRRTDIFSQDVLSTEEGTDLPFRRSMMLQFLATPDQPVSEKQLRGYSPSLNPMKCQKARIPSAQELPGPLGLGQSSMGLNDNLDLRTGCGAIFRIQCATKVGTGSGRVERFECRARCVGGVALGELGFPSTRGNHDRDSHRVADKGRTWAGCVLRRVEGHAAVF